MKVEKYQLLPKNASFKQIKENPKETGFDADTGTFKTNFYQYMSNDPQTVYLYKVETNPPIRPDANKTWARVIKTLTRELERSIGLITHRNDTLWGSIKSRATSFLTRTALRNRQRKPPQQQNPNPNQQGD